MRRILVFFSFSMLGGCPTMCEPTVSDLTKHEIRQLSFWGDRLERPLAARIEIAPPELLDYIAMDNQVNGFEAEPEAVPLTDAVWADVVATLEAIPVGMQRKLQDKLLGVFVVRGLGSSGYTDYVREGNVPAAAFVVIDVDAMNRKANAWLAWKESSPFVADPTWTLAATLEAPEGDTVSNALQFVLIHELGHVVAFDEDVHPLWSLAPKLVDPTEFPFMDESWKVSDNRFIRKVDKTSPAPGPIVYYKPSVDRPTAAALPRYYDWLAQSSFVTLYAATSPFDDFADSLATYVHTVAMGKPFEIRLYQGGKLERTVSACWTEPRCAAKRKILEDFLE